jgi:hypothetical protein
MKPAQSTTLRLLPPVVVVLESEDPLLDRTAAVMARLTTASRETRAAICTVLEPLLGLGGGR